MRDVVRGLRALVVDDEPLVRNVFRRWLERAGLVVVEAASVSAACAVLEQEPRFDVVLTDLNMPGLSGCELIAWIRERWPLLPVIMVSAYPEAALELRADLVLEKPVRGEQLQAAIAEVLADHRVTERMARLSRTG